MPQQQPSSPEPVSGRGSVSKRVAALERATSVARSRAASKVHGHGGEGGPVANAISTSYLPSPYNDRDHCWPDKQAFRPYTPRQSRSQMPPSPARAALEAAVEQGGSVRGRIRALQASGLVATEHVPSAVATPI